MASTKQSANRVTIACTGAALVDFHELVELQGALKRRDPSDVERMARSIVQYGFSFPFFVWKSGKRLYCLDGHGRLSALALLEEQGYEVPPVPVSWVTARDKAEAKQKLLRLNSAYGEITLEGLTEFTADIDVEWDEIVIQSGRLQIGDEPDSDDDGFYSRKIIPPVYEIKGERPALSSLTDTSRYEQLLAAIEAADIPADVAQFLRLAAARHIVFEYGRIAEFYAHADAELQRLMEDSALVIIDAHKAIANGFLALTESVAQLFDEDYPDNEDGGDDADADTEG